MKRLLLTFLAFLAVIAMNAEQVSKQEALQIAQQFMPDKQFKETASSARARSDKSVENEAFYIFNAEDEKGFVIVSGDDRTEPILGYSDSGCLDLENLPPNLKGWLEGYSKQIKALKNTDFAGSRAVSKSVAKAPKAAIEPLITTKWGQDYPYNMNCPDFFGQGNCVTGCVATAMAQVMYYHRAKSTKKTTAKIPGYNGNTFWQGNGQLTIDAIPDGAIIDWDNMLECYNGSETDVQKEAVANLMLYCGVSIKMNYGVPGIFSGGSSAYFDDVPVGLKQYFDYSEHTGLVYRHKYTDESWDELIYSELNKGNPVLYGGSNGSAGHAFVCDGYDGDGYYHINWGWEGLSNSYFLLSALNPSQQGTGGSSGGYNDGQCALIGAVPNGDISRLTTQNVTITGNTSFILNETGDNVTLTTKWTIKNQTDDSRSFDHAIGLYYKGDLVTVLKGTGSSDFFSEGQEATIDVSLNIGANLSSGVYQLYALSRISGEDMWFRNQDSSDCYITLVVKDGSMSLYIGKPAAAENVINFSDDEVKRICVENWDTDGDGEISCEEAASVTDFGNVFVYSNIETFDEAQYFTGITSFGLSYINEDEAGCASLKSIKLPSSVTSIKDGAFFACKALTSIDIPASVKVIGKNAFQICFSLQDVVFHEGLENIDDEAFQKCPISSIHIPASVSSLGDNLWYECTNLNDFYVDNNNSHYCSFDGVIFTKDEKTLVYFPCKREGTYNIPEGTEAISSHAFTSSRIEFINIPASVTSIGREGFGSMLNLQEITIPSTVTNIATYAVFGCVNLKRAILTGNRSIIPEGMFGGCWSLRNIGFPTGLVSIGPYAFWDCDELIKITIPSTVTSIGDYAFASSGLRKVTSHIDLPCTITSTVFNNINSNAILYVPEGSLDAYKAADNWKNFSQILPISETIIELEVGDANEDGAVDANDIVDIVNNMTGNPTSTGKFNEMAADANEDGVVNIADVVKVTNIIMGE